jgi:hypothetical protein
LASGQAVLDAAETNLALRAGAGARVQRIPDDGNCVPRAFLAAARESSDDDSVMRLRSEVLGAMAKDRERYEPWVWQGPPETGPSPPGAPTGEVEGMFDRHLLRMGGSGIFFEEPEIQALADLKGISVVVASGDSSRKIFAPKVPGASSAVSQVVLRFYDLNDMVL